MKKIYKYVLDVKNEQIIEINSENILSVESQVDDIVVYALVDVDNPIPKRYKFKVFGTGNNIEDNISNFTFLGTVKMHYDSFVFHVFYSEVNDNENNI